jgi:hypothetical protein
MISVTMPNFWQDIANLTTTKIKEGNMSGLQIGIIVFFVVIIIVLFVLRKKKEKKQ